MASKYAGMISPEDSSNTIEQYIEVFHSAPLWDSTWAIFSADGGEWLTPATAVKLDDLPHRDDAVAVHAARQYRVLRVNARALEFVLCDGTRSHWDNNRGENYKISVSGVYVAEEGVGARPMLNTELAAITRAQRADARYIELIYESNPKWLNCFVIHTLPRASDSARGSGAEWTPAPGVRMTRHGARLGSWFLRIQADSLQLAFTDGGGGKGGAEWDSNFGSNYMVPAPGKYEIIAHDAAYADAGHGVGSTGGSKVRYLGISDLDALRAEL
mmetsp:Transcript_15466/g.41523  ORF Transcript_15466/g.41523 Transcript_15466/m.41523 type:complete len:272 (+) Transcript_15466:39-854(+)